MGRKRFVDLSISIEPDLPSDPPIMIPKIDYVDHTRGAEQMKEFFYHPIMDQNKPALTIDEIPLGWCFNDGVLLDFRHKGDGERMKGPVQAGPLPP